ncbi:MAG: cytochrome c biogenesis protein CcdA [bacterium]
MNNAPEDLSLIIAFAGGLLSFLSPCVLPMIPSYLAFITGLSFEDLSGKGEARLGMRRHLFLHSFLFIIGFSSVFISLGASATLLGNFLIEYRGIIQMAGGILIILFGIHVTGIIQINLLQREKRIHLGNKPIGYLGSFIFGLAFAAGWTPCVGPILGSILIYATTSENVYMGFTLLSAYSLGLGLPFLLVALGLPTFLTHFGWINRHMRAISIGSGLLLILVGIIIFTDNLGLVSGYLTEFLTPME